MTAAAHRPDAKRVQSRCRVDCSCGWSGPIVATFGEGHEPWVAHFHEAMPHRCPHCGEPFGWGPDAALLAVVNNVPFDELAPCCGERLVGVITDGVPRFVSLTGGAS